MRFDKLPIGAKFFHASSAKGGGAFEKKSLSSAFTLDSRTLERQKFDNYARESCGFSGSVEVHALHSVMAPAEQMDLDCG